MNATDTFESFDSIDTAITQLTFGWQPNGKTMGDRDVIMPGIAALIDTRFFAKVPGSTWRTPEGAFIMPMSAWEPHKNIGQAMRCFHSYLAKINDRFSVRLNNEITLNATRACVTVCDNQDLSDNRWHGIGCLSLDGLPANTTAEQTCIAIIKIERVITQAKTSVILDEHATPPENHETFNQDVGDVDMNQDR